MIDSITRTPIEVSTDGNAGPYIMVPVNQLDQVVTLLNDGHLGYWVDSDAISIEGEPEIAVVNLERGIDVSGLQQALDNID